MLKLFIALKEEIAQFLENGPRIFPEFEIKSLKSWNQNLLFFYITAYLNDPYTQLQGKKSTYISNVYSCESFQTEIETFQVAVKR